MVITKEQIQFGNGNDNGNKFNFAMVITKEQIQFGNGNGKGKNTIWQEQ